MRYIYFLAACILGAACNNTPESLPILGERTLVTKDSADLKAGDTLYAAVPEFSFVNQDGDTISNENVKGKIYVADFFFVSCPTICPVMKKNMIQVYESYKGVPDFMILSHTIDPDHDSLPVLKDYATRLGSDGKQWMFLRGNREATYQLAEEGYYATAMPDSTEPGGFVHSGGFLLVDPKGRIRGMYNGTDEKETEKLIQDIALLQNESKEH